MLLWWGLLLGDDGHDGGGSDRGNYRSSHTCRSRSNHRRSGHDSSSCRRRRSGRSCRITGRGFGIIAITNINLALFRLFLGRFSCGCGGGCGGGYPEFRRGNVKRVRLGLACRFHQWFWGDESRDLGASCGFGHGCGWYEAGKVLGLCLGFSTSPESEPRTTGSDDHPVGIVISHNPARFATISITNGAQSEHGPGLWRCLGRLGLEAGGFLCPANESETRSRRRLWDGFGGRGTKWEPWNWWHVRRFERTIFPR